MQGRSSNWRPTRAGSVHHLDWKSLHNGRHHVWWKRSILQVQSLSRKQAYLHKSGVKITLSQPYDRWSKFGSSEMALYWILSRAESSERVVGRANPARWLGRACRRARLARMAASLRPKLCSRQAHAPSIGSWLLGLLGGLQLLRLLGPKPHARGSVDGLGPSTQDFDGPCTAKGGM